MVLLVCAFLLLHGLTPHGAPPRTTAVGEPAAATELAQQRAVDLPEHPAFPEVHETDAGRMNLPDRRPHEPNEPLAVTMEPALAPLVLVPAVGGPSRAPRIRDVRALTQVLRC